MRLPSVIWTTVEWGSGLGHYQWCMRVLMVVGAACAMMSTTFAAHGASLWALPVGAALTIYATAKPDSDALAMLFAVIGLAWWRGVDDDVSLWSLSASLGLLTAHVGAARAAVAAPGAVFPSDKRRRLIEPATVALATAALWLFAVLVADAHARGSSALVGLALLGLLGLAGVLHIVGSTDTPPTSV